MSRCWRGGGTAVCAVEGWVTLSVTDRHKSNTTGQDTRHTCFIKPIRRHSPPHHSSHQTNHLQHRELFYHRASDETCTRCNLIPVPPAFSHPHLTPKCTKLRLTTPTIHFYGTISCVLLNTSSLIYMYSVLHSIFLYFTSVVVSVGDPTMRSAFFV
jgi:hypothetical protein